MSGYVYATGRCYVCGNVFTFNPHRVPSVMTDPPDASTRMPICSDCIKVVNKKRVEAGMEPWPVYEDSYSMIPVGEL